VCSSFERNVQVIDGLPLRLLAAAAVAPRGLGAGVADIRRAFDDRFADGRRVKRFRRSG
jgi:hypothetical protein